jgi:hypothetical protein
MSIIAYPDVNQNYLINVARGFVPNAQPFNGYGQITTAGAVTTPSVLWPDGTYVFPPSSGLQMSIVSTSANDTAGGTGVQSVHIHYLDSNLAVQSEIVTLNGLTPVLTVATNIRFIQCMHINTIGSGKVAAGNIIASNSGQNYSQIDAGYLRCSSSVRMVPAGQRLFVTSMYGGSTSGTASASAIISIASPSFEGHDFTNQSIFIPFANAAFQDGSAGLTIPAPMEFTAGQAVGLTFTIDKAGTVVGSWFGWLENA